jgi:hypothetical protein
MYIDVMTGGDERTFWMKNCLGLLARRSRVYFPERGANHHHSEAAACA